MMRAIDRALAMLADGLEPPPSVTVSQWADRHRILPQTSSQPGQWVTDRTPYLREIMDRLSPQDPCEVVVVMKGSQLGFTAAAENWMGHAIHYDPAPAMIVQPTWNTARSYARDRIKPLISETPILSQIVGDQVSRRAGTTTVHKQFPGGFLIVTGANSAAELRSRAIRKLALDEVDGYPDDVDNEGDPVALAMQRTSTFSDRKVMIFSTPTVTGNSRIESEYSGNEDQQRLGFSPTDQRRFFVPCPRCGTFQTLEWEHVKWTEIKRPAHDAAYVCPHCRGVIENHEKNWMLPRGEWRATAETQDPKVVGYHISGLYRPHGWRSWGTIAAEFQKAKRQHDTNLLRVIINTDFAQTWQATDGATLDPSTLQGRCEDYSDAAPYPVVAITAGVDIQHDRIELEIVGWGADEESWSLDYRVLWGDTSAQAGVWDELDELLGRRFEHPAEPEGLPIAATCVDASDQTERVCEYTKPRRTRRIWAIKGRSSQGGAPQPIWNMRPRKPGKGKYDLYPVGVDAAKELLYARLHVDTPGPGFCHFSRHHNDETYFAQLTAERLRTKYVSGRAIQYWWKPHNRRNEALDCRVYAMAALRSLFAMGYRLDPRPGLGDDDGDDRPQPPITRRPAPKPAPKGGGNGNGWMGPRRKGWVR